MKGGLFLKTKRIAIIGGGASGICAALEAKYSDPSVLITIFERLPKIAKKILATGNGRCNYTNENLSPSHFYGNPEFLRQVLTSSYADTENYFRTLGLLSYHEDGRIYPRSQQAASLRDVLIDKLNEDKITLKVETPVNCLVKHKNGFKVNDEYFDAVIVACGGKASPVQGSDGSCYSLIKSLGHTITPLYPALCGLTTNDKGFNLLKGVRTQCKASLYSDTTILGEESGEVQFTDKGVSGIPVMNLSHLCKNNNNLTLSLDLCEDISESELSEHIKSIKSSSPHKETENLLSGIVNLKLGFAVMNKAGLKPHTEISALSNRDINNICDVLKAFDINITCTKGFDSAQVTCGGVNTEEVNPKTMMSKILDGLFLCGEVLDIHADCGGYNLHLAWTTGRIAGNAAIEYLNK